MTQTMDDARERLRGLNAAIHRTEMLIDEAAQILEEFRIERKNLTERVERMQMEDAVEYPEFLITE